MHCGCQLLVVQQNVKVVWFSQVVFWPRQDLQYLLNAETYEYKVKIFPGVWDRGVSTSLRIMYSLRADWGDPLQFPESGRWVSGCEK